MSKPEGFSGFKSVFQSFNEAFGEAAKRPLIGLTQGGSSRRGPGESQPAKPAANDGTKKKDRKHG